MIKHISDFFKSVGKRKVTINPEEKKTKLFFIPAKEITAKEETKGGLITGLTVSADWRFREIKILGEPEILDKKRGIARVVQEIKIKYDNSEKISEIFEYIKNIDLKVSVLRIDENGNAFLMGENKGMKLISFTEEELELKGEEDDIFYKVSSECVKKLTGE